MVQLYLHSPVNIRGLVYIQGHFTLSRSYFMELAVVYLGKDPCVLWNKNCHFLYLKKPSLDTSEPVDSNLF
jgi:hypothetical protein